MEKKSKIVDRSIYTINDDDYASIDVASCTEITGAALRPPLTDAEAENYSDIISMPQQRADHADQQKLKKSKRKEKL
jgi:hypothetical protein